MKRKPFRLLTLLTLVAMLGLTGCSRTTEDVEKWKASGNIEKLIKALTDPKVEVRLAATEALGELKAEPAVDALVVLYNDPDDAVILASVESLAAIGTPSVITPMTIALKLEFPIARLTAAETLGQLKAVGAVNQLVETLDDSDAEVQLAAAVSLGLIGDESGSEGLAARLNTPSTALRKACVISLGLTGGELAAEGLIGALADENEGIEKAARESLIGLGETAIPFALEALKSGDTPIRAGAIAVLRGLKAVPETGSNMIWYQLARASVDRKEGLDKSVVQTLVAQGESAYDTLLEAAAHPAPEIRENATFALERGGKNVLPKAEKALTQYANDAAIKWMAKRGSWAGAPSWRIDLWASLAALNPQFEIDSATVSSLEMQARPAFNIIANPQFKPTRPYIPMLIDLLGDTTKPPPEQPDYDADGIPIVKQKRDMFRGEANRMLAEEKLAEADYFATLPLIAAIEDDDELIAGNAADILGSQGEKRALRPLMNVVQKKLDAGDVLSDSPFYVALQKMDEPQAEPLLLKIRPNPDRAMRVFERKYPGIRPMSAETKDDTGHPSQPVSFRLGYIDGARVGELIVTFMVNADGNWEPAPPLPEQLPAM
jgi:HEAT repeat protein